MIGGLCHFDIAIEERGRQRDTEKKGRRCCREAVPGTVRSRLAIVYSCAGALMDSQVSECAEN